MDSVSADHLMSSDIRFEIVDDSAGFRALEDDWLALCVRAAGHQYFQRFPWQWRVWRHVASTRGRRLRIFVGRSGGRLVLVWPLMRDGRQGRMLASDKVEYRDILVEDGPHAPAWMEAAWNAVLRLEGVDLFLFQDIRESSNLARLLTSGTKTGWRQDAASRIVRLDRFAGWDAYAASLPKHMMNDQKRQWRRIAALGKPVRFEIVRSKDALNEALDWIMHHKLAWLQASGKNDVTYASPEYSAFLRDVAEEAMDSGYLLFAKLCVGDDIVSAGFGYHYRNDFIFHVFTYDAAWQSYSPGRLLLEHIIKWCFDHGVAVFDFMPGEEGYKAIWTNDEFGVTDYLIPVTLRGAVLIKWHASGLSTRIEQNWLKAVFHRLPDSVRRRLGATLMAHREYSGRVKRL